MVGISSCAISTLTPCCANDLCLRAAVADLTEPIVVIIVERGWRKGSGCLAF